jgi:hypothetical protein
VWISGASGVIGNALVETVPFGTVAGLRKLDDGDG